MQLLNTRTLELNQTLLEKMRLEEHISRLSSEVEALRSENDLLRAEREKATASPPKHMSPITMSDKKTRRKQGSPGLEQYMKSFKRKLKRFIRVVS